MGLGNFCLKIAIFGQLAFLDKNGQKFKNTPGKFRKIQGKNALFGIILTENSIMRILLITFFSAQGGGDLWPAPLGSGKAYATFTCYN